MKVEKQRRFRVDWVEYGTLYFRWYKTEGAARALYLTLIHDVNIPAHLVNISEQ